MSQAHYNRNQRPAPSPYEPAGKDRTRRSYVSTGFLRVLAYIQAGLTAMGAVYAAVTMSKGSIALGVAILLVTVLAGAVILAVTLVFLNMSDDLKVLTEVTYETKRECIRSDANAVRFYNRMERAVEQQTAALNRILAQQAHHDQRMTEPPRENREPSRQEQPAEPQSNRWGYSWTQWNEPETPRVPWPDRDRQEELIPPWEEPEVPPMDEWEEPPATEAPPEE